MFENARWDRSRPPFWGKDIYAKCRLELITTSHFQTFLKALHSLRMTLHLFYRISLEWTIFLDILNTIINNLKNCSFETNRMKQRQYRSERLNNFWKCLKVRGGWLFSSAILRCGETVPKEDGGLKISSPRIFKRF